MSSVARANRAFAMFWGSLLALDAIGFLVVLFGAGIRVYEHLPWYWTVPISVLSTSLYQVLATCLIAWLVPYPDRWFGLGRYREGRRTKLYRLDDNGKTFNVSRRRAGRGTLWADRVYYLRGRVTGPWFSKVAIVAELTSGIMLFVWLSTTAIYVVGAVGILAIGILGFIMVPVLLLVSFWQLAWGDFEKNWPGYNLYHFGDRN